MFLLSKGRFQETGLEKRESREWGSVERDEVRRKETI